MDAVKVIDVVGKSCPLPLIILSREIRDMAPGSVLRITGNDPIFEPSMMDFCSENGHEVLEVTREGRKVSFTLKVAATCSDGK